MMATSWGLFLCLLLCAAICLNAATLGLQVEPKEEQCFFEEMKTGEKLELQFEVLRGGLLDIKFKFYNPRGKVIEERMAFFNKENENENVQEGSVNHVAEMNGEYKFCFDNTMSRWTPKVINFETKQPGHLSHHEELAKLEHLGPMVDSIIKISDDLDVVEKQLHIDRIKERVNYELVASSISTANYTVLLQLGIVMFLSWYSINRIQKSFKDEAAGKPIL